MSNPSEEDWKKMTQLVDWFYKRPDAEPFQVPVDWKAFGLTDYPQIIKHPMDLGTVKQRLKNTKQSPRHYKTLYQVAEDVRLVWKNCQTYNADGSDFFKLAQSLQAKWDEKYSKLLKECSTSTAATAAAAASKQQAKQTGASGSAKEQNKVTLQDKKAFCRSLYQISKEDLGRVLVEVETKCPAALVRSNQEQQIEFNVDNLPANVLQELTTLVNSCKFKKKAAPASSKAAGGGGSSKSKSNNVASSTTAAAAASKK